MSIDTLTQEARKLAEVVQECAEDNERKVAPFTCSFLTTPESVRAHMLRDRHLARIVLELVNEVERLSSSGVRA